MNASVAPTVASRGSKDETKKYRQGVVFTEYPMWFAFAIAIFITISETIFGFTLRNALILKHIALILFVPAFLLYLVGRTLQRKSRASWKEAYLNLWPFIILGMFAISGSLYARYVLDIRETFLVLGIYILLMPMFFTWSRELGNTKKIVEPFVFLWGTSSIVAMLGAVVYFDKAAVLHSIEFLVQPFFVYLFFSNKTIAGKVFSIALLAATTILTQKLTGYINGIAALTYIIAVHLNNNVTKQWRGPVRLAILVMCCLIAFIAVIAFVYFRDHLPSGNIEVRLHQYDNVFSAFLASPIWGQAYTATSGEIYTEYTRKLTIPTHSDILDLMKQGGIIALLLWLAGMYRTIKILFVSAYENATVGPYFHGMTFLAISVATNCAVNPLFLTPTYAFVIWGSLAIALGVATDQREGQFNAA